jgi:arginine/lysine/histidine transporter system substrate-binding protein
MKKLSILFILLALMFTACSAPADEPTVELEQITVLTSPDYPPYESIDATGNYIGFDIELMEAIAEILGVEVVWKEQSFDGIIAGLQAGQGDMAISGMNVNEERKLSVDFSDIYKAGEALYTAVVLTEKGYVSIEDLAGLKIGVQTGTVQESAMNSLKDKYSLTIDSRASFLTIIEDIKLGRLDALVIDYENATQYSIVNPELGVFIIEDADLDNEGGTAIALPKGSVWTEKVNAALAQLKEDGTLAELDAKWFTE